VWELEAGQGCAYRVVLVACGIENHDRIFVIILLVMFGNEVLRSVRVQCGRILWEGCVPEEVA
jgi:hypothetical protein